MQRGRELEKQIEEKLGAINQYCENALSIRLEIRQARVKGQLVYCKSQPFDYAIILPVPHPSWFFDAKECSQKTWYPATDRTKTARNQKASLLKMQRMGHRAGFLVYFKYSLSLRFIEDWSKPITCVDGVAFDWQEFFDRG